MLAERLRQAGKRSALCLDADNGLNSGDRVLVHCVGGLGRSGMAAAAYLRTRGAAVDEAIEAVRAARSQRALETAVQEEFIQEFPPTALE
jgi:protein-tyrosine phosphatase